MSTVLGAPLLRAPAGCSTANLKQEFRGASNSHGASKQALSLVCRGRVPRHHEPHDGREHQQSRERQRPVGHPPQQQHRQHCRRPRADLAAQDAAAVGVPGRQLVAQPAAEQPPQAGGERKGRDEGGGGGVESIATLRWQPRNDASISTAFPSTITHRVEEVRAWFRAPGCCFYQRIALTLLSRIKCHCFYPARTLCCEAHAPRRCHRR